MTRRPLRSLVTPAGVAVTFAMLAVAFVAVYASDYRSSGRLRDQDQKTCRAVVQNTRSLAAMLAIIRVGDRVIAKSPGRLGFSTPQVAERKRAERRLRAALVAATRSEATFCRGTVQLPAVP